MREGVHICYRDNPDMYAHFVTNVREAVIITGRRKLYILDRFYG